MIYAEISQISFLDHKIAKINEQFRTNTTNDTPDFSRPKKKKKKMVMAENLLRWSSMKYLPKLPPIRECWNDN